MKTTKIILTALISGSVATFALAGPQIKSAPSASTIKLPAGVSYPATVVELFTSQGCSSCPPANGLVRDISGTDELLTLSYSVDYWDYLGWKDTFGKPEFSSRQRDYGHHFQGQVYTPQIVINGAKHASKFSKSEFKKHSLTTDKAVLDVEVLADGIKVSAEGRAANLFAVIYTPGIQSIPVGKGENRGRTIKLANVVTSCSKIGGWKRGEKFSKKLDALSEGEALAILAQESDGGPILAAVNYLP